MASASRTGRRPGDSGSREAILGAARAAFAVGGYEGTSVRAVARAADVDAALVHHFYGTKHGLFLAALELPGDFTAALPALLEGDVEALGERLVTFFLGLIDAEATRGPLLALIQAAMTNEQAAELLRVFVTRQVISKIIAALDVPQPELRATLVGSQLVGLAIVRQVVRVAPLATAEATAVVAAVAPAVQRYLTGDLTQAARRG
ncbi:MAG: TetR/AcrR family transcriptional regulator [Mycobacteriaceae bacterium]